MRGLAIWEYALACEALHFLLGFLVALSTYLSISIMYFIACRVSRCRPRSTILASRTAVFFILCFSLSASVVSHVLEDYFFSFF